MPREAIVKFTEAMENKLKQNDHKRHWSQCGMTYLLNRLKEEVEELVEAVELCEPSDEVKKECADVANFAMMIFDIMGNRRQ